MHLIIIAAILIVLAVLYFSSQANRYQNKSVEHAKLTVHDSIW